MRGRPPCGEKGEQVGSRGQSSTLSRSSTQMPLKAAVKSSCMSMRRIPWGESGWEGRKEIKR
jgi:hypothetical protein